MITECRITLLPLCREEVRLLKEELTEEYEADKQAAMTQLSQQKELEMMAAREGWQRKVEDLLEQVNTHLHHSQSEGRKRPATRNHSSFYEPDP